jgi:hypothetical protein
MFRRRHTQVASRFAQVATAWAIAFSVVILVATLARASNQVKYPIYTPENFVAAMQNVGLNFPAVNAALAEKNFPQAKAHLVRTRERLALTITFWRDRNKEDAIKILRESLAKMDALDGVLSKDPVDATAANALAKEIGATCQSCHAAYREQDPGTRAYRFKPGLVQ